MFDIIIIGAGPAGLMAAKTLKKGNITNFLIIDSKKEIGYPLRCGEGIGADEFHEFFKEENYDFIKNKVTHHDIIYEDLKRTFRAEFYQLDRPKFEQWLAKDLKENLKLETRCIDIKITEEYAEVITDKGDFKTKLIILAYGCNFNIQSKLDIENIPKNIIAGYGGIYKVKDIEKDRFYYYFPKRHNGYLWIFPKSEGEANIGFSAFNFKGDIRETLKDLLKEYKIEATQISEYSGVVPCSGPIGKTYADRILICGNAAGMVYAGTGEGIYFALKSGKLAASAASDALNKDDFSGSQLKNYEQLWKNDFGEKMLCGMMFADIMDIAYDLNIVKKVFAAPSEDELKRLVMLGIVPLRAKVFWKLAKLFRLKEKKKIPSIFRILYRIMR